MPNPKSRLWNKKKQKKKTQQVQDNNSTKFYCKNEIRTNQNCDKKQTKVSVEQTKSNGEFYLYLNPLGT